MGELIRNVGKFCFDGSEFNVELNKSTSQKNARSVHVQNEKFRLELSEREFVQLASCVLLAKKQFDILKGADGER